MSSPRLALLRLLPCLLASSLFLGAHATTASAALPRVTVAGHELRAGTANFRSFGFNYSSGGRLGTIAYNLDPSAENRATLISDIQDAKRLRANTLRIYLQLHDFVYRDEAGTLRMRADRLANYVETLKIADSLGMYLDVTGNLTWMAEKVPAWYDAMSTGERWQVQAFFWEQVARASRPYDSVFCYELTSEPTITDRADASWYAGDFGGFFFSSPMAKGFPASQHAYLAQAWTTMMRNAVRKGDDRHLVTVGMLPFSEYSFGARNLAPLLDFLIVHEYPNGTGTGGAPNQAAVTKSIDLVKRFAAFGKPVVIGETAMLSADPATQSAFMMGVQRYVAGMYGFFDGRTPAEIGNADFPSAFQQQGLQLVVDAGPWALAAPQLPEAFPILRLGTGAKTQLSTMSSAEADGLVRAGWKRGAPNGYAFTFQRLGTIPVHRLFDRRSGDHRYTANPTERAALLLAGFRDEGVLGYAYATKTLGTVPLLAVYHKKSASTLYTVDAAERDRLVAKGWKPQGTVAWVRGAA